MSELAGASVLVTGVTGQVARPVAIALAGANEVYGAARFRDAAARERLEAAGVRCVPVDLVRGDLSALPERVDYVLHFGVVKSNRWHVDLDGNVGGVLLLMERYASARAFLHCSSTSVYEPKGHEALSEDDMLGDSHKVLPYLRTYSISKIAAEGAARHGARRWELPTTIARLNVPYGDDGGWPAIHLEMMAAGMAIPVHPDAPTTFNPLHEDDVLATLPGLLAAASVPATVVNWGGDEEASIEEWCAYLAELTGCELRFEHTTEALQTTRLDLTRMHELVGHTTVPWREGMLRMVRARRPDLLPAST